MSATDLCKSCGLCCTGVWFTHGLIADTEVAQAQAHGFPVRFYATGQSFSLPCAMHKNGCCSAYATWRPKVCESYACAVLNEYQAENITFDEAQKRIKIAQALVSDLPAQALSAPGGLMGTEFVNRLAASVGSDPAGGLSASACISSLALRVCFDKYFRVLVVEPDRVEPDEAGDDRKT